MGVFLSGQLFLRSNVVLFIDSTAILKASMNASLFARDDSWPYQSALVAGYNVMNAGVAGGGAVDGQAPMFVTSLDGPTDQFKFFQYHSQEAGDFRLRLVDFKSSQNVIVQT